LNYNVLIHFSILKDRIHRSIISSFNIILIRLSRCYFSLNFI